MTIDDVYKVFAHQNPRRDFTRSNILYKDASDYSEEVVQMPGALNKFVGVQTGTIYYIISQ